MRKLLHRIYRFLDDDRNAYVIAQFCIVCAFVILFVGVLCSWFE